MSIYNPSTGKYEEEDHRNHHGGSPLDPWNRPSKKDDPFAPWNRPMYRDDPHAAWNNPIGGDMYGY
jgi:hypothetical protein